MDETNILEQPETLGGAGNVDEQNSYGEEAQPYLKESGSNIGKFKDSASLLEAYNNLEREFTKKSQKLAELLKNSGKNNNENSAQSVINLVENNFSNQQAQTEKYKQDGWTTYANDFILKNPDAKQFAGEMFEIIKNDKTIASSPNCLEYAFAIAKQKHQVSTENLLNDQTFIDKHVLNNERIKETIINDYLKSLAQGNTVPRFISGTTQNIAVTTPETKPKTIKDASNILRKLLNN